MSNDIYKQAIYRLLEFENKNNPYMWQIDGIPIWWFVRFRIFVKMLDKSKKRKEVHNRIFSLTSLFKEPKNYIKKGQSILYPLAYSIRKLRRSQYLFLGSTNCRRSKKNGKYYNILLDPVIDELGQDKSQILEWNDRYLSQKELCHTYSKNLIILDRAINKLGALALLDIVKKTYYSKKVREILSKVDPSPLNLTSGQMERILILFLFFVKKAEIFCNNIIDLVKPEVLFVTCGYCFWNLIFQFYAKKKKVKIVELQHGIINENHVGYVFPKVALSSVDISPFPDHLFLFGEKYKEILEKFSIVKDRLIVFGYLYMRDEVNKKIDKDRLYSLLNINKRKKIVLVTSQTVTQDYISDFLHNLANLINSDYHIVLKLHQREKLNWENKYSKLIDRDNITIIFQEYPRLYDLLKISYVHTSVCSTVLHEAIVFNVPNIILQYQGYENVIDLIEKKGAFLVQTPKEFIKCLDKIKNFQYDEKLKHYFFDLKQKNMRNFIVSTVSL